MDLTVQSPPRPFSIALQMFGKAPPAGSSARTQFVTLTRFAPANRWTGSIVVAADLCSVTA